MKCSFWGLAEADKYLLQWADLKKKGESMTEIHRATKKKDRKGPEKNQICYIPHSIIQLQVF